MDHITWKTYGSESYSLILHESEMCKTDMICELTDARFGVAEEALSSQDIGEIVRTMSLCIR